MTTKKTKERKKFKMRKVAIIILTYNSERYFRPLLDSLRQQDEAGLAVKIIVIDNASVDGSIDIIKNEYSEVLVIQNKENLGFAAGNNVGLKYAINNGFDYTVLLNQDIRVDKDWLVYLAKSFDENKNLGAVQPLIRRFPVTEKINTAGNIFHYLGIGFSGYDGCLVEEVKPMAKEINYASGAAMMLAIPVLKKIGLFDESFFMYHEDTDLALRLKFAGYKIFLNPKAQVYHQYEFSRSIKKFYFIERNRYVLLLKFYKWPTLFLILPAFVFLEAGMFCQSIFTGYFLERLKAYKYFFSLKNLKDILLKRKVIQKTRLLSDRQLLREATGKILFQEVDNILIRLVANPILNGYKKILEKIIFW
jgi:GT2 family glycosyltransferase